MKNLARLVLAAVAWTANVAAQEHRTDEALIRDIDAAWSDALERKSLDEVASVYAEDAVFLAPGQPVISGKPAIREWFRVRFEKPGYHASFVPTKITTASSGDLAYEIGTFRAQTLRADGATLASVGKHLVAWKKIGGKWLVVAESISTDTAQPTVLEH